MATGHRLGMIRSGGLLSVALLASCDGARQDVATTTAPDPCLITAEAAHAPATSGMLRVDGGVFLMGAQPLHSEEGPPRETHVGAFWIDQTEVTNRDFARFVDATGYVTLAERPLDPRAYPGLAADMLAPSSLVFVGSDYAGAGPGHWWAVVPGADWRHPKGPQSSIEGRDLWPVVHVGWEDALAYATWLGRDLPTEAEWEFAARGGLKDARYTWGDEVSGDKPAANTWQGVFPVSDAGTDGYKAETAPVGCFPANGFGLYDMAGNVWEWTRDWYAPGLDPDDASARGPAKARAFDPSEPGVAKHVIKGGSFLCADNYCLRYRPPARQAGPTDTGSSHIGFRTVLRDP